MVAAGAFAEPSPALTAQAARDLRVAQGLEGAPAVADSLAPLTDLRPELEQPVTVVIIEDHPVVTEGVASWIRSDPASGSGWCRPLVT
jgi:hypothetical protein